MSIAATIISRSIVPFSQRASYWSMKESARDSLSLTWDSLSVSVSAVRFLMTSIPFVFAIQIRKDRI